MDTIYGMRDQYNRKIDYLRISVTDRCNLRCQYCMPEKGVMKMSHQDILTYEEIEKIVGLFVKLGIKKIKITGGEPLVRKNIFTLIKDLKSMDGIEQVTMTTNGLLLKNHLDEVFDSGLDGLNISIDTLDPEKYCTITRGGNLEDVLYSLHYLIHRKFKNLKVNMVHIRGFNDDEIVPMAYLAKSHPLQVRYIELMPIGYARNMSSFNQFQIQKILEEEFGNPTVVKRRLGNGPANYLHYRNFVGNIGFIDAIHHKFCQDCNRVRLSANGFLRLCLQYDHGIDLSSFAKGNMGEIEALKRISYAVYHKPLENLFLEEDVVMNMNEIGG